MAATVSVCEWHNGSLGNPDYTNVSSSGQTSRYCTMDAVNPNTSNPMVIPASGQRYSYWKHHSLSITVAASTKIDNIRFYTDGNSSNWTMGTTSGVYVLNQSGGAPHGVLNDSYELPTGTEGTEGFQVMDNNSGHSIYNISGLLIDIENFSSGNPVDVDTNISYSGTGKTLGIVSQIKIDDDATQGDMADLTATFMWDEI